MSSLIHCGTWLVVLMLTVHGQEPAPRGERKDFCDVLSNIQEYDGAEVTLRAMLELSYEHGMTLTHPDCRRPFVLRGHEWPGELDITIPDGNDARPDRSIKDLLSAIDATRRVLGKFRLTSFVTVTGRIDLVELRSGVPGQRLDTGGRPGTFILKSIQSPGSILR